MQLNIKDIDAFREAAKEAGLKLSDHEVKVPKWYERKSYDCAVITFEDMLGKPVSVTFKDCSAYRDDEITATANRKGVSNSELVGELMRAHIEKIEGDEDQKIFAELPEELPPHPLRDELMPVLSKLYPLNKPPAVVDAEIAPEGRYKYELTAGVMAVIRIPAGASMQDKVKSIIQATAEADAWAYRKDARREYADLVNRVKNGYGKDQRDAILKAYAELRMLQYFNGETAQADVAALPEGVRPVVEAMRQHYVDNKQAVWDEWMAVKMYARRVVAGDEPFRSVLREIKKELGQEEPPPRTWEESFASPAFAAWGAEIRKDEELLTKLTNLRDLRDREAFLADTHSLWVIEGSPEVPKKAAKVKIDPWLVGAGVTYRF